jgi:hypothetical protein
MTDQPWVFSDSEFCNVRYICSVDGGCQATYIVFDKKQAQTVTFVTGGAETAKETGKDNGDDDRTPAGI